MKTLFRIIIITAIAVIVACSKDNVDKPIKYRFIASASNSATGGVVIFSSFNGVDWKKHNSDLPKGFRFEKIIWAQKRLWAIKQPGCRADIPLLWTSTDGIKWQEVNHNITFSTAKRISDIYYHNGKFVLSGEGSYAFEGSFRYSTDGYNWSEPKIYTNVGFRDAIVRFRDKYISYGLGRGMGEEIKNKLMISDDLENWEMARTVIDGSFNDVVQKDGVLIASRNGVVKGGPADMNITELYASTDGNNWQQPAGLVCTKSPVSGAFEVYGSIFAGDDSFIGVGKAGEVAVSANGFTWSVSKITEFDLYGVCSGNNGYVVTATNVKGNKLITSESTDIIYYSKDLKSWRPVVTEKAIGGRKVFYVPVYQ